MKQRKRNRLMGFDYSNDAQYFITICCKNRICHFGYVEYDQMILNEYGKIANDQIHWLIQQYPYVVIHNFVVMPNHVHVLFEIDRDRVDGGGTGRDLSLQIPNDNSKYIPDDMSKYIVDKPLKIKSVSELMGAYKTTSSKQIHNLGFSCFGWQRSFHDRIVRDRQQFHNIDKYITNNPKRWDSDSLRYNCEEDQE